MQNSRVPPFTTFFNPTMKALTSLGRSAALSELEERVAKEMRLSEEILNLPHVRNRGTERERITAVSEFAYRLRWALTYLKKAGLVNNSQRGVWAFTEKGASAGTLHPQEVVDAARTIDDEGVEDNVASVSAVESEESLVDESIERSWQDIVIETLHDMSPDAFERLAQRLLREAGFEEVIVTGKSGDGGIDGRGLIRINELVGFSAVFQCKRYKNSIGPEEIRAFRGAMMGRADRALFITTARFSPAAQREAVRDVVTAIELIDGARLATLLKALGLGVTTRQVEHVTVDVDFFDRM